MAYKVKQPRLSFQTVVDASTANTVEFCLHENTLGVSRQALRTPDVGLKQMFLMCNPATHYGPDLWHRDSQPSSQAPLAGLQADMLANGPGLVQWNIALYDDDVLWIVPGSHRRLNTAQENRELLEDRRTPLSSGMQVKLEAGDGVMYINSILHWPSLQHQAAAHHPPRLPLVRRPAVPLRIARLVGAQLRHAPVGRGAGDLPAVQGTGCARG